jgi:hypothetical protein
MNGLANTETLSVARVPPKLESPARKGRAGWVLGIPVVLAAGAVLYAFSPAEYSFYPFCLFHEMTGLHCPGCGGTRAAHQLLHGNVLAALRLNALLVVSLPFCGWWGIGVATGRIGRRPAGTSCSLRRLWLLLALALVFGVLRNLPAFAWLAP